MAWAALAGQRPGVESRTCVQLGKRLQCAAGFIDQTVLTTVNLKGGNLLGTLAVQCAVCETRQDMCVAASAKCMQGEEPMKLQS